MTASESSHRYPRSAWLIFAFVAVLSVVLGRAFAHATQTPTQPDAASSSLGKVIGTSEGSVLASVQKLSPLIVSGSSPRGLAPGVTKAITINVKNPNGVRVRILKARIVVGDASEGCRAHPNIRTTKYLASAPHAHRYVVRKHSKITIPLTITMRNLRDTGSRALGTFVSGNQNACKGVRFPISFRAKGRQA